MYKCSCCQLCYPTTELRTLKYFAAVDLRIVSNLYYKLQYNVKNTTAQRPFLDFVSMAVSTEQDRQCTYSVTLSRIRATVAGMDKL